MPTEVKINPQGGNIRWSLKIGYLKVAAYRAFLLDSNNRVLEKWIDQRTDDHLADSFTINVIATNLLNTKLWIQAIVTDPAHLGGTYNGVVTIEQDNTQLIQDSYQGNIPAGKGKLDQFVAELTFC